MKRLTKSILCGLIFTLIIQALNTTASCEQIRNSVFRLHIMANSDSAEDQQLKLDLRDRLLEYTESFYKDADSLEATKEITESKLASINAVARGYIYSRGYDYEVKTEVINMYFTTREYENFTLPAGYYDALRIVIGSGKGHNWWCVMFPQLCLPAADREENTKKNIEENFSKSQQNLIENGTKYRYKFKIIEWFEEIADFFK